MRNHEQGGRHSIHLHAAHRSRSPIICKNERRLSHRRSSGNLEVDLRWRNEHQGRRRVAPALSRISKLMPPNRVG